MHDIVVTIITVDRSPRPNYLPQTLANLRRAGVFESDRFHSIHVADSGGHVGWPDKALTETPEVIVHRTSHPRPSCSNAAAAMDAAVATGAPWVLFCEDDIDVCGDFLESVGRWLDEFMAGYHVAVFGANYPHVQFAADRLEFTWEYPLGLFYGSQCIALRNADASLLADYWRTCPEVKGHLETATNAAIDLMVSDWHCLAHPDQPYLLASAPSFIQHIGRESYATSKEVTHKFASWPGPFWTYEPGVVRT